MWDLSSPMRDGTHNPCTGSQSLNHWTTGSLCFYFFIQFLGKSCGQRSLVGCSPWGREELDTTEQLHFPFSLSCIGEGNGNPLQCSCLENPRDGSLVGGHLWGHTESDMTEQIHFHFPLSCIGEGNGNPLQYSCLENPRDGSLVGHHLRGCTESDMTDVT